MNLRKYVIGLHKQIRRLTSFKVAYQEWSDKTDWIQKSAHWSELGKHRADVMLERFNDLECQLLDRVKERDKLAEDYEALHQAVQDAEYRADQGKVWNGMGWSYIGLSSHAQQKVLDILRAAISSPENHS